MRFQLLATALACSAAFVSFGATAAEPYPDAAYNGAYVIEVLPANTLDHSNPKCMIFDPALGSTGLRLQRGANGGLCGSGTLQAVAANPGSIWDIAPVKHTDGRKAYVVRSRANGKCLIRGWSGTMVAPNLHEWNASNPKLCGWNSEDALIDNGQAAWVFGEDPNEVANVASNMAVLRNGLGYLSFASSDASLKAGQTMITVDHAFRFVRVPETCDTSFALQPDVIRVCGVGDFAQPVKVSDAAYLDVPFTAWYETGGAYLDYGDGTHYMAIRSKATAHLYCSRLRTGNFSDWRLPTLAELRTLPAAFPNNGLRQFGWTTGFRGHWSSDGFTDNYGRYNFYSVRFFNASEDTEWDANPYPIACIR